MLSFPGGQVEASSSPRGVSIVKLMGKKSGYIAMQVRQAVIRWGERVAGSGEWVHRNAGEAGSDQMGGEGRWLR